MLGLFSTGMVLSLNRRQFVQPCLYSGDLTVNRRHLLCLFRLISAELFKTLQQTVSLILRGSPALKEFVRIVICDIPNKLRTPAVGYWAYRR